MAHHTRGDRSVIYRQTFKEKLHRDIERLGKPKEPACANPPHALFIFLDLLKRQTDAVTESLLAQSCKHSAQPHTASNMYVDMVGTNLCLI